jgi:hypothetical protein
VEHSPGEKITFFHLDCLARDVRLNVDFDLTLTVVAAMLSDIVGDPAVVGEFGTSIGATFDLTGKTLGS